MNEEKAILKMLRNNPEMGIVIKMLQENDIRNARTTENVANALNHTVDRTISSIERLMDIINEMSYNMVEMNNKIVCLEEKIKKLEGDNMENKTIELCNNVVESKNDDDFLKAYMDLTAALKAEVQQDIENEKELYEDDNMKDATNIHSEMTYGDSSTKILCDGKYHGINFWILNNRGSHPCAYIEIPEDHEYYEEDYDDVQLPVHGGLTFSGDHLTGIVEDTWILGWDYGHWGDRTLFDNGETHYVENIIKEVKKAIENLISQ